MADNYSTENISFTEKPTRKNFKDIEGMRFGRLVALGYVGQNHRNSCSIWLCRCDCGTEKIIESRSLLFGNSQSCGCLHRDISAAVCKRRNPGMATHGMKNTPEWRAWHCMKGRCLNHKDKAYHWYGGRGITICEEWIESFESFFAHVGLRPSESHSLDRIDNEKGYVPGNVRWATMLEQNSNRRSSKFFVFNGELLCVAEISRRTGVAETTLRRRLLEMPVEDAVSLIDRRINNGKTKCRR